jgi:hypothetical protein
MVASALTSAAVALLARGLPYKLSLMLAALAGVIVGVWFQPEEQTDETA